LRDHSDLRMSIYCLLLSLFIPNFRIAWHKIRGAQRMLEITPTYLRSREIVCWSSMGKSSSEINAQRAYKSFQVQTPYILTWNTGTNRIKSGVLRVTNLAPRRKGEWRYRSTILNSDTRWSAWRYSCFTPRGKSMATHWIYVVA
jgi:hypothetical protein